MARRILLMHISNISGHKEASSAIEQAIKSISPTAETLSINIFDYVGKTTSKIVTKIYLKAIKNTPAIWGFLYDNKRIINGTKKIKEYVYSRSYRRVRRLIEGFKPDVVVATQAFPCGVCAEYKRRFRDKFKLVAVMTDYAPHAYWFENEVNYYVVGSEELKCDLIKKGIAENNIKVFGIPIDSKFKNIINASVVFEKLQLDRNLPVILIMGGGQGIGPIKKIIKSLKGIHLNLQIILVCGTNKKLEIQAQRLKKKHRNKIIIFGFTRNIDELMSVATLIITKPGGLTTSEALAKQVPLIIVSPIPGQEIFNTNYLVKKGVAIYVERINAINTVVENLLNDKDRLENMRKNALCISKPNASVDIASFTLGLC
ncbi:MAG: glycosyltransferase [Candidatus Omnitrophota bacterium]